MHYYSVQLVLTRHDVAPTYRDTELPKLNPLHFENDEAFREALARQRTIPMSPLDTSTSGGSMTEVFRLSAKADEVHHFTPKVVSLLESYYNENVMGDELDGSESEPAPSVTEPFTADAVREAERQPKKTPTRRTRASTKYPESE